jgi:hypothetical protein
MNTYRTFPTLQQARTYRHEHGTGGWIFEPTDYLDPDTKLTDFQSILFPPEFLPVMIFAHPFTRGRNGNLIGT